jgi:3-oxoacyl-[acyl-carrier-protein] synthase III
MSKVYSNIAVHGNTSSASIPIALDECVEAGRDKGRRSGVDGFVRRRRDLGRVLMRW